MANGPKAGPVFPVERGERAGQQQLKRSHARELRAALWMAGVHMPLEGFEEAAEALRAALLGPRRFGFGDALYMDGVCKPALDVPAGASRQERALARMGRRA